MPDPPSPAMVLGSALDQGINTMLLPALDGAPLDYEGAFTACRESVEQGAPRLGEDDDWIAAETPPLLRALQMFYVEHDDWRGRSVQRKFSVELGGVPVEGWIDREDADGTIVDHKLVQSQKFAKGQPNATWVSERRPQLALYLAAANAEDGGDRTKAKLEVCYATSRLKTPQWNVADLEIDHAEQDAAVEDVRTAWMIAQSGVYSPNPGPQCAWCSFREPCQQVLSVTALSIDRIAEAVA